MLNQRFNKMNINGTALNVVLCSVSALFACGVAFCSPAWSDKSVDTGYQFYQQGNYAGALMYFHKAAERGDEDGQFIFGNMYAVGEGVQQDFRHAAFWYRKAAEKGFALAQYDLGTMYYNGLGLSQDFKHAYAWLFAASENGYVEALIVSYYAAAELDAQTFAEAQKLATKYLEQYQPGK